MRSPGTEEADNPLPLPNKGCCRPCQPLLSALLLTGKLRWGRGGPWVGTKALGSHAVTLRCPCWVLPCGRPQNLPPALGRLKPGSTLPRGPVTFPSQTRASSPRDAEPTGGWAGAQPASLLRLQLSFEKQRLPFCEGQTRLPSHEDGEIRVFY